MFIAVGHAKQRLRTNDERIVPDGLWNAAIRLMREGQKLWLCISSGQYVAIYSDAELGLAARACYEYNRGPFPDEESEWTRHTSQIWESAVFPPIPAWNDIETTPHGTNIQKQELSLPSPVDSNPAEVESSLNTNSHCLSTNTDTVCPQVTTLSPSLKQPRTRARNSLRVSAPPLPVADTMFRVWRRELEEKRKRLQEAEEVQELPHDRDGT